MSVARKKMCQECPFNSEGPGGYIGPYASASDLLIAAIGDERFPCHTDADEINSDCGEGGYEIAPTCAGSLQFMKATLKSPRVTRAISTGT